MNKEARIYIIRSLENKNMVCLSFKEKAYCRPLESLDKIQHWIEDLWDSGNYTFRPFLGRAFGLVITKKEK